MGILDLLKEVPLSAVLREKIIALETENKSLKEENTILKSKLDDSEQQRRALENQIEQKLIEGHSHALDEIKEKILSAFIEHERLSPEMIAELLGIKTALASYHLNDLNRLNMAVELSAYDGQTFWGITQEGRAYLVSHGLLA